MYQTKNPESPFNGFIEMSLVASIGQALLRKSIIDQAGIFYELIDKRLIVEGNEDLAYQLACIEIDSVVHAVRRW